MSYVRPKVSALTLTYNSGKTIGRSIASIIEFIDEIVIVDSGSGDNTKEIVREFGRKIKFYFYEWENSFSVQRNFGLTKITGDWCICIDSDEIFEIDSMESFCKIFDELEKNDNPTCYCPIIVDAFDGSKATNIARVFKCSSKTFFHGRVHEYITSELKPINQLPLSDITLTHYGYPNNSEILNEKKLRNYELLKLQLTEEPSNLRWKYFMIRYLQPNDKLYEDILGQFSTLALPYEKEVEVYCFNMKHRIIKMLIKSGDIESAIYHCNSLLKHYCDVDTTGVKIFLEYCIYLKQIKSKLYDFSVNIDRIREFDEDDFLYEGYNLTLLDEIYRSIKTHTKKIDKLLIYSIEKI